MYLAAQRISYRLEKFQYHTHPARIFGLAVLPVIRHLGQVTTTVILMSLATVGQHSSDSLITGASRRSVKRTTGKTARPVMDQFISIFILFYLFYRISKTASLRTCAIFAYMQRFDGPSGYYTSCNPSCRCLMIASFLMTILPATGISHKVPHP